MRTPRPTLSGPAPHCSRNRSSSLDKRSPSCARPLESCRKQVQSCDSPMLRRLPVGARSFTEEVSCDSLPVSGSGLTFRKDISPEMCRDSGHRRRQSRETCASHSLPCARSRDDLRQFWRSMRPCPVVVPSRIGRLRQL